MDKDSAKTLEDWRDEIDEVDRRLVRLLARRTECAIEIGKLKARGRLQVYDPQREEDVMANVQSAASGHLTGESARRVFERIVDETRRTEREHRKVLDRLASESEGGGS